MRQMGILYQEQYFAPVNESASASTDSLLSLFFSVEERRANGCKSMYFSLRG